MTRYKNMAQDYVDVSAPVDKSNTREKATLTHNSNTRRRVASSRGGKGLEDSISATAHWRRQGIPTWGYESELQDHKVAKVQGNIIPRPTLPNRATEEIPEEIAVPPSVLLTLKSGRVCSSATQIAREE